MTPEERAIYRWEGGLIIQIDRLADVQKRLTKQLVVGRLPSEVAGAYMDLRNIANQIERLTKEMPPSGSAPTEPGEN